jgi:NADPH2:quinone reductase
MPHAIRVSHVGGPEVLEWTSVEVPPPGAGEVQLRQTAIGLNFIDVYHRTGLYPQPLPFVPGNEGAGVITALGANVTGFTVGQRVAYATLAGAYAEVRNASVDKLIALPVDIDDATAASVMLKGMTAEFLLLRCHPVGPNDTVLFHAAAGGVGQLAIPWARQLGATVIGVVGREEKVAQARAAGAQHVVLQADFVAQAKALTGGRGVDVVYDSVGKDTFQGSLDALRARGTLVSFGQSSGKAAPLDINSIGGVRSLFVTRPSLFAYVSTRAELEASAASLFEVIRRGVVKVPKPTTFPLREVAEAHRALEARQTTGSVVLLP